VQLEKFADVKIGDHARKDAPPGFVSWKFITDSIQQAGLCNIDDYKIGSSGPRPVGGPQPPKGIRHRFTAAEDEGITKHIVREMGIGRRNMTEVYQVVAETVCSSLAQRWWRANKSKFPTHTWQSIENRWKKKLRFEWEKNPPLEDEGRTSAIETASSRSPVPAPQPVLRERAFVVSPISEGSPQHPPRATVRTRTRFTSEDDTILRKWVQKREREGEALRGNKIYKELEEMVCILSLHKSLESNQP
jgi:hypothetical protein